MHFRGTGLGRCRNQRAAVQSRSFGVVTALSGMMPGSSAMFSGDLPTQLDSKGLQPFCCTGCMICCTVPLLHSASDRADACTTLLCLSCTAAFHGSSQDCVASAVQTSSCGAQDVCFRRATPSLRQALHASDNFSCHALLLLLPVIV